MFFQEMVLNGVLCYRTDPSAPFAQYSPQELTEKYLRLAEGNASELEQANFWKNREDQHE